MKWLEVFSAEVFVVVYNPDKLTPRDLFFGQIFISLAKSTEVQKVNGKDGIQSQSGQKVSKPNKFNPCPQQKRIP